MPQTFSTSQTARAAAAIFDELTGSWSVKEGPAVGWVPPEGAVAGGFYDEGELPVTGWALLDISMLGVELGVGGHLKGTFGLGYLEGHFTCHRIEQFLGNFMPGIFKGGVPDKNLVEWVEVSCTPPSFRSPS